MRINEAIKEVLRGYQGEENGTFIGFFKDGVISVKISPSKMSIDIYDNELSLDQITTTVPCKTRIINKNMFEEIKGGNKNERK